MDRTALGANICLVSWLLSACASAVPVVPSAAGGPSPAAAPEPVDSTVIESVRAYLRAFKLNEKDLPAGLSIPWARYSGSPGWTRYDGGVARVTGRTGPNGHEVYEVIDLTSVPNDTMYRSQTFLEIAPDAAPAGR